MYETDKMPFKRQLDVNQGLNALSLYITYCNKHWNSLIIKRISVIKYKCPIISHEIKQNVITGNNVTLNLPEERRN